jgi:HSP20 family protein
MNIVRRNNSPLSGQYRLSPIEDQFGRVFENMIEDFFSPFASSGRLDSDNAISPRLNLSESDKAYEVEVEIPGISKENVKVAIDDRRVTIDAEEKREDVKEGENMIYAERLARKFSRTFSLPSAVDDASAQARVENGVLHLTLPKKDAASAKRLTIQ